MYQYRMQRVLDVKVHHRTIAEKRVQEAKERLQHQERRVASLISERKELQEEMFQLACQGISISQLRQLQNYDASLVGAIEEAETMMETCQREEVRAETAWRRRRTEEKMWEKLREKDFEEYQLEQKREEQQRLDDMVTSRHPTGVRTWG